MEEPQDQNSWVYISGVNVSLLIKLIQHFPQLYNHQHKNFKNNLLKEHTWAKIAATLKVPVDDCLRVWRNVRDKYTRERRILTSEAKMEDYSKWEFYDAMDFLRPFIRRRRTLRRTTFHNSTIESREPASIVDENSTSASPLDEKQLWKLSPDHITFLDDNFEDGAGETEEITLETEDGSTAVVKEIAGQPTISIIRHQTSEEAFGAYVASRLMDFPPEVRKTKKVKIFRDLEDIEDGC